MAEREGKNPAKPRAGAGSAFDGLSQELLVKILERSKDVSLAAAPVGEPATVSSTSGLCARSGLPRE